MKREEDILQEAAVTWFKLQYPHIIIFHIPNEGVRGKVKGKNGKYYSPEGVRLKKIGKLKGVLDLFIMRPKIRIVGNGFKVVHGLFLETKIKGTYLTDEQKEFWKIAIQEGYECAEYRNIDEFINIINEYLS